MNNENDRKGPDAMGVVEQQEKKSSSRQGETGKNKDTEKEPGLERERERRVPGCYLCARALTGFAHFLFWC